MSRQGAAESVCESKKPRVAGARRRILDEPLASGWHVPGRGSRMRGTDRSGQRRSSVRLFSLSCCIVLLISAAWATAQQQEAVRQAGKTQKEVSVSFEEVSDLGCSRCHYCNSPTPENQCLSLCTRFARFGRGVDARTHEVPDVIILDELERLYLPVPFDHKGHAQMAEMADGCVVCHHYTPAGQQHPACKTCHDMSTAGTDIYKPGLKGAYHQQCLNCHRDWTDEKDCDICHRRKAGGPGDGGTMATPTKDDILKQMHAPIPEPEGDFYRSRSDQPTESQVVFRHREHVHRFGLNCVDCHHEPSCARCHTRDEAKRPRTLVEHHRPCIRCHKRDMDLAGRSAGRCERCHWVSGRPEPEPFNHADTGWLLGRFHQDKGCRDCHTQVPFVRLSKDCNDCHSGWGPSVFDHRVTGQVLDENHVEHDCELCHIERKFDRAPTCDECHDEEDAGITFPARRPGPGAGSQ